MASRTIFTSPFTCVNTRCSPVTASSCHTVEFSPVALSGSETEMCCACRWVFTTNNSSPCSSERLSTNTDSRLALVSWNCAGRLSASMASLTKVSSSVFGNDQMRRISAATSSGESLSDGLPLGDCPTMIAPDVARRSMACSVLRVSNSESPPRNKNAYSVPCRVRNLPSGVTVSKANPAGDK